MSFGEICEAAALVVAKAVQGKADLVKLDLNGKVFFAFTLFYYYIHRPHSKPVLYFHFIII